MRAVRIRIEGRVQGVGFRAFVEREAQARTLDGFVRNRRDGGVEIVAAGPATDIGSFIEACRRGPRGSKIAMIKVIDEPSEIEKSFIIAATV